MLSRFDGVSIGGHAPCAGSRAAGWPANPEQPANPGSRSSAALRRLPGVPAHRHALRHRAYTPGCWCVCPPSLGCRPRSPQRAETKPDEAHCAPVACTPGMVGDQPDRAMGLRLLRSRSGQPGQRRRKSGSGLPGRARPAMIACTGRTKPSVRTVSGPEHTHGANALVGHAGTRGIDPIWSAVVCWLGKPGEPGSGNLGWFRPAASLHKQPGVRGDRRLGRLPRRSISARAGPRSWVSGSPPDRLFPRAPLGGSGLLFGHPRAIEMGQQPDPTHHPSPDTEGKSSGAHSGPGVRDLRVCRPDAHRAEPTRPGAESCPIRPSPEPTPSRCALTNVTTRDPTGRAAVCAVGVGSSPGPRPVSRYPDLRSGCRSGPKQEGCRSRPGGAGR